MISLQIETKILKNNRSAGVYGILINVPDGYDPEIFQRLGSEAVSVKMREVFDADGLSGTKINRFWLRMALRLHKSAGRFLIYCANCSRWASLIGLIAERMWRREHYTRTTTSREDMQK